MKNLEDTSKAIDSHAANQLISNHLFTACHRNESAINLNQAPSHNSIQVMRKSASLFQDERGLSSVEYVILLVMIVVGAVATWKNIGSNIKEGLGKAESDSQLITEGTGH